jgi:hypothetical protein
VAITYRKNIKKRTIAYERLNGLDCPWKFGTQMVLNASSLFQGKWPKFMTGLPKVGRSE